MFKKPKKLSLLFSLLAIFAWQSLFCQDLVKKPVLPDTLSLPGMIIPPLGQLILSAQAHSPLLDEQSAMIAMRQWQVKSATQDWARYLLFFSEYRYGTVDVIIANGTAVKYGAPTGSTYYNVGARLQMSIFDVLDLKQKRGVADAMVKYETKKKEELERMIKDDVIRLWNRLISYQEIVRINEDHIAAQNDNIFYAEQQYKAGDIPLVEYARIKEISVKAQQEYELAKKEFREAYYLLESLVGVKLSALNLKR